MVLAVNGVNRQIQTPPARLVQLVQSLPDDELVEFFKWLDQWIRTETKSRRVEDNIEGLLRIFLGEEKVQATCAKIRTALSRGLGEKHLLDYLRIDKPIVFFDIETAGLEGNDRRIVELSLIKFFPNREERAWTIRLNPQVPIQEEATKKHGIRDMDVKDHPTFKDMSPALLEFFNGCHLGGFNILNFDIDILQKEFGLAGMKFDTDGRAIVDVMSIYHGKVPYKKGTKRDLSSAYRYYCEKELEDAHQAKADIRATVDVLLGQYQKYHDLPTDVYELSNLCTHKRADFADSTGKFIFGDGKVIFNFGKYRDKPLNEIVTVDPGYLQWILKPKDQDFSEEVKEIVRNALEGKPSTQAPVKSQASAKATHYVRVSN